MSADLKLRPETWDLLVEAGQLATIGKSEEVAQRVLLRLQRTLGEWFLNTQVGLPWYTQILGSRDEQTATLLIRKEILATAGVSGIEAFSPIWNNQARTLDIAATISTVYGTTEAVKITQGA